MGLAGETQSPDARGHQGERLLALPLLDLLAGIALGLHAAILRRPPHHESAVLSRKPSPDGETHE